MYYSLHWINLIIRALPIGQVNRRILNKEGPKPTRKIKQKFNEKIVKILGAEVKLIFRKALNFFNILLKFNNL